MAFPLLLGIGLVDRVEQHIIFWDVPMNEIMMVEMSKGTYKIYYYLDNVLLWDLETTFMKFR